MPARKRALLTEAAGFATVGLVAFGADLGAFLWLRGPAGLDPMAAKALSFLAGVAIAYTGNALGPYRLGARRLAGGWRRFAVFLVVNAAGGAVQLACLGVSRHVLGLTSALADTVSGAGVGMVLGTAVRFWGTRTLVFSRPAALERALAQERTPAPQQPARGHASASEHAPAPGHAPAPEHASAPENASAPAPDAESGRGRAPEGVIRGAGGAGGVGGATSRHRP
ncbi:GtrA family protein [Streptomyces albus]|uniref:GtrA family protein n=1 Tax=Streptomyces albus TaxID=1888 RepID=UPI003D0C4EE1